MVVIDRWQAVRCFPFLYGVKCLSRVIEKSPMLGHCIRINRISEILFVCLLGGVSVRNGHAFIIRQNYTEVQRDANLFAMVNSLISDRNKRFIHPVKFVFR